MNYEKMLEKCTEIACIFTAPFMYFIATYFMIKIKILPMSIKPEFHGFLGVQPLSSFTYDYHHDVYNYRIDK